MDAIGSSADVSGFMRESFGEFWTLSISPEEALTRLGAAMLAGFIIGIDREWRRRPAGLRTHMLVSLASAAFTIMSFEIYAGLQANGGDVSGADPLRLLEAITAAVAFLAAGTIMQRGGGVEGITTGAGLWLSGALGMACGQAMYAFAAVAAILTFIVLSLVGVAEIWFHKTAGTEDRDRGDDKGRLPP